MTSTSYTDYKRKIDHGSTPTAVPDPSPLPDIKGPYVMVRPVSLSEEGENAKIGSIMLPDSYKEDVESIINVGKVLKLGELAYVKTKTGELRYGSMWCKQGDYVVWGKLGGKKIVYKGVKCVLLNDDEIMMVVESPDDINPHKNLVKY